MFVCFSTSSFQCLKMRKQTQHMVQFYPGEWEWMPIGCSVEAVATMIGCLPTQPLAFSPVSIQTQRTYATQTIAFGWKPGLMVNVGMSIMIRWRGNCREVRAVSAAQYLPLVRCDRRLRLSCGRRLSEQFGHIRRVRRHLLCHSVRCLQRTMSVAVARFIPFCPITNITKPSFWRNKKPLTHVTVIVYIIVSLLLSSDFSTTSLKY